jgi:CBS domain-containing protein
MHATKANFTSDEIAALAARVGTAETVEQSRIGVAVANEGRELRVRDLMTLEPVTVRGDQPLAGADQLMRQFGVSGLPVVDQSGGLVGVLSRTDVMALAGDPRVEAWQGKSVAATMTAPSLTIEADAPLGEAAAKMEEHHVHRLVVVEAQGGRPVGILSTADIVRAVASREQIAGASH